MQLYGSENDSSVTVTVQEQSSTNTSWTESGLTWNNKPSLSSVIDSEVISGTSYQWYTWGVSSHVRGQYGASANAVTLALTGSSATSPFARFHSKENTSGNAPKLVITTLLKASSLANGTPTSSTVPLTWADNSDNEAGFKVQRSADGGTNWSTLNTTAANATSYTDSTVAAATSYKYRVVATHANADAGPSNVLDVSVPPTSPPPPSPPTGTPVTLYATGDAYVRDGTYASTNYGSDTVLQVKTDGASNARDAYIKFDVSGLSGTAGSAKLRLHGSAANGAGSSASSLLVSAFALDNPAASWIETGTGSLTWNNRPYLSGWSSTTTALDSVSVLTSGGSAWYELDVTSFINAEIAASRSVSTIGLHVVSTVNVTANFDSRETAYDPELVVTPVVSPPPPPAAPAAPSGLTATAASSSQVDLAWTDNSDNEQGFKVQRSADSGSTWSTIHTTAADADSWSDTTVSAGQTYKYRVLATHTTADSGATNEVTVNVPTSPPPPPPAAPNAPSDLVVVLATGSQVDLQWTDNSSNETGFTIQRSTASDFASYTTFTNSADDATFSDTTVTSQATYYYRVRADNGGTPSGFADAASAVPNDGPTITVAASASPSTVTGTSTTLTVTATDDAPSSDISYFWQLQELAPGYVDYSSANGTATGNAVTATFNASGTYEFVATATDSFYQFGYQTVTVTVTDTLTSLSLPPPSALSPVGTHNFAPTAHNQFGSPMALPALSWGVTGGGTMDEGTLTYSPDEPSHITVTVTHGTLSAHTTVVAGPSVGQIFNDANGNGSMDPGESALAGWQVYADLDSDGIVGAEESADVTDASGLYAVDWDGCCGAVTVIVPNGWEETSGGGYREVTEEPPVSFEVDADDYDSEDPNEQGLVIPLNDGSQTLSDFVSMVISVPDEVVPSDTTIVLEFDDAGSSTSSGTIKIYTAAGYQISSGVAYTLDQLGFSGFAGGADLLIERTATSEVSSSLTATIYDGRFVAYGSRTAYVAPSRIFNIWQVSFGATVPQRFHAIRQDGTNFVFDQLQWQDGGADQTKPKFNGSAGDAGERWYPVAYTRTGPHGNVTPTIGATIHVQGGLDPAKTYLMKGVLPGGAQFGPVAATTTTLFGSSVLTATLAAQNFNVAPFVNVEYYNIGFYVSDDNGATWKSSGMSRTKVYVTAEDPLTSWTYKTVLGDNIAAPYETVIDAGCRNAIGANKYNDVVNSVYGLFAQSVQNGKFHSAGDYYSNNRAEYQYWGKLVEANAGVLTNTTELIRNKAGQCNAWADFFADVLRAQGIHCNVYGIYPQVGAYTAPPGHPNLIGFKVNNDAKGQGSATVEGAVRKDFADHAIVKLSPNGVVSPNLAVYDPSYGRWFPSDQKWRDDSLAALVYNDPTDSSDDIDVSHAPGTVDTYLTVLPY